VHVQENEWHYYCGNNRLTAVGRQYIGGLTRGFLTNTTTPPQAVRAYSSGCSLRGPLTCATSLHRSPPCWLAPPKRPSSSVLALNNRERSQTAQPWTSICIAASNGSSFLATHRGNGYALRACHLMMMMITRKTEQYWNLLPLWCQHTKSKWKRSYRQSEWVTVCSDKKRQKEVMLQYYRRSNYPTGMFVGQSVRPFRDGWWRVQK